MACGMMIDEKGIKIRILACYALIYAKIVFECSCFTTLSIDDKYSDYILQCIVTRIKQFYSSRHKHFI